MKTIVQDFGPGRQNLVVYYIFLVRREERVTSTKRGTKPISVGDRNSVHSPIITYGGSSVHYPSGLQVFPLRQGPLNLTHPSRSLFFFRIEKCP